MINYKNLRFIKNDLHCNAVRICGLDIDRLVKASEVALKRGLEVWLSPGDVEQESGKDTRLHRGRAAAAEKLRSEWPEQLVLSVGSEVTLFTKGIVPGNTFVERLRNPSLRETVKAGKHNKLLDAFLAKANEAVRQVFHGQVT